MARSSFVLESHRIAFPAIALWAISLLAAGLAMLLATPAAAQRAPRGGVSAGDASSRDVLERPYGDGPLTFDDFAAKTPEGVTAGALLTADIRYHHLYRGERRGQELAVQLTGIEMFAMVLRYKSWIFDRQNEPALAYPQGHFDIDQLQALKCQRFLMQKLAAGETFIGVGKSEQEAVAAMEQSFQKVLGEFVVERGKLHRDYDRATAGGANREAVAEQRKSIGEQIDALTAELKKMSAAAKRTPRRPRR